ncbi:MAG TPA: hydroxymethylbilane synthase, partial [Candidatus Hydrogenedentes bacterium]|nr:hydroxymethylbilane synthase [Candidatus Hydrogenedentota bacterium]
VSTKYDSLEALPSGATVGTSSLRRRAQLLAYRADLCVVDLRGNVDTRIRKVAEGELDAAILACAGLSRIGRNDAIRAIISTDIMLPAPAQGALGIEIRAGDPRVAEICSHIHDEAAHREATAERACLAALEGGCQIPIGAHAQIVDGQITLSACVCSVDGTTVLRVTEHASAEDPAIVGEQAAARLLLMGAAELIAALR